MARFTTRSLKRGQLEIQGLESFVKSLVSRLLHPAKARVARAQPADPSLKALVQTLDHHSKRALLLRAGKQKDQLLRSLIPLYLARKPELHLSSGAISRFWAVHGVKFAPPNAAKALREHVGYARLDAKGRQITPNGIRYVEAALHPARHKRAA